MTVVQKGESIRVVGLKEFRDELKALEGRWGPELTKAAKEAADLVAVAARAKAESLGGVAHHVAGTIRATGAQQSASIWLGDDAHPEAMGAEFGSARYHQFKGWRGSAGDAGYFMYPTLRQHTPEVVERYAAAIDRLFLRAFPD